MDLAQLAIRADSSDLVRAKRDLDALPASSKRAESATSNLTSSYSSLGAVATKLIGVLGAAGLGATLIRVTDQYTKLNAQLSIAARTQADYTQSMQDVVRISNLAQSSIEGTATLYARLANTLKDTNVTQQQFANITESVALGLRVSGASVGEAQSAMLQLSQAFASGVLRGEEFNAVAEASFPLMKALADSMGIPIEQLRSMAMEGKITRNELVKAFGDQALIDSFKNQAKELNTVSGAMQVLKNNLTVIVGEINATTGASNGLAQALLALGNSSVIRVPFETLAVLGVNIAYVFKQVGNEIGGIAAQLMALVKFDFKGVGIIRDLMLTDAKQARIEVDALSEAILNPKAKKSNNALSTEAALINTNLAVSNQTANTVTKSVAVVIDKKKEYQAQLAIEITDLKAVNTLLQQGVDIEQARLIVTQTRGGASKEQIAAYQAQLDIQSDIEEAEQARQERLKIWIDTQQKAYEDELKAIETTKKANEEASKEYLRTVQKAEEDKRREYERTADQLNRSLTDALLRGFESGKGFARNFKDTLINMFKTLVLTPVINFILKPVSDALAGALGGQGGLGSLLTGGSSSTGGLGGIFSDLGNIFTKSNQSIIGGIESVGASIANGMGGIRDTIGGFLGSNASLVANVASYGGAVLQLAQGNWAGAAGTAIGTALGGPVGGAIGSFLGGAIGSLFGSKKQPPRQAGRGDASYVNGVITNSANGVAGRTVKNEGMAGGLSSAAALFSESVGSLLKSFGKNGDVTAFAQYVGRAKSSAFYQIGSNVEGKSSFQIGKYKDAFGEANFNEFVNRLLGVEIVKVIQSSSLDDSIKELFAGLTDKTVVNTLLKDVISLQNNSAKLNTTLGITVPQVAQLANESGIVGEQFTNLVNVLNGTSGALFTIGDAMVQMKSGIDSAFGSITNQTLPSNLKQFDAAIKSLDKTTEQGRQSFLALINLRAGFEAFTNQMEALKGGTKGALFSLAGLAEQQEIMFGDLVEMFAQLGQAVPSSTSELIALGKSIDYTTAQGINLAAVFPQLTQAFTLYQSSLEGGIGALQETRGAIETDLVRALQKLRSNIDTAKSELQQAFDVKAGGLTNRISELTTLSKNLREFVKGLRNVVNTPSQNLRALQDDFKSAYKLGLLGNVEAASSLVDIGGNLATATVQNATSSIEAQRGLALIANQTLQVATVADRQASVAEQQLAELNALVAGVLAVNESNLTIAEMVANVSALQSIETQTINLAIDNGFGNLLISSGIIQQSNEQIRNEAIGIKSTLQSLVDIQAQIANVTVANFAREQAVKDAASARMEAERIAAAEQAARDSAARAEQARQEAARIEAARAAADAAKAAEINRLQAEGMALKTTATPTYGGYTMMNGMNSGTGSGGLLSYLQTGMNTTTTTTKLQALRDQITAMGGVPQFANGGAFTNGIVSTPTMFNMGQMGEAGSEAIMPLTNVGGQLGVRSSGNDGMRAEIKQLREEMGEILKSINKNVFITNRQLRDWSDGERLNVNIMQEVGEVVAVAA